MIRPLSSSDSVQPIVPIQPTSDKQREPETLTASDIETMERLEQLELSTRTADHNAFLETPLETLYTLEDKQMSDALRKRVQYLIHMRLFRKPREQFTALFEEPKEESAGGNIDVHA